MTDEQRMSLAEIRSRATALPYGMIKYILENNFDPHWQSKEMREVFFDWLEMLFTGDCKHPEKYVVQVKATGDLTWGLNGGHCRACGQKVKPKVVSVVWETDAELPSPPRSA